MACAFAAGVLVLGAAQGPALADIKPVTGHDPATWIAEVETNSANDLHCLATAIYFEARGEPVDGQAGVAEVILNRVSSKRFPDTVCDVVYQGARAGTRACQFSFACDGKPETVTNKPAWQRARALARAIMEGRTRHVTDQALYFHADYVAPSWARRMVRTTQIGRHIFYREPDRTALR
ncbi:cell wall hydrolase [Futiania mangrovi]|uniref:Cell wall hydrolase n=1 Tax=Futiania mangrovi TaxID=2959716 RepID=A0A9J6PBM5_9PROT|nr:cell wall hydrolase [Futiania mangrovii]MCP1337548.1 cell wall hydrolase [Futiania mangrovii]